MHKSLYSLILVCSFFFTACSGGSSGSDSNSTVNNPGNKDTPTSPFDETYVVNVTISNNSAGSVSGGGSYKYNDTVKLSAVANSGFKFIDWESKNYFGTNQNNPNSISSQNPYIFKAYNVDIEAVFKPCSLINNEADNILYSWSISSQQLTLTNNNDCKSVFVLAVSTPLCNSCTNDINTVFKDIPPKGSLVMHSGMPAYPSWKPVVIYTSSDNNTYAFDGSNTDKRLVTLLGYNQYYENQLAYFSEMQVIDAGEDHYGDCYNFSWLDRSNGIFQVAPDAANQNAFCYVGNIVGYTDSGSSINMPQILYFVTDKSKQPSTQ